MKAIITKFVPCTTNRGSRLTAYDAVDKQNRITISYPHDEPRVPGFSAQESKHARAVLALCKKMKWSGNYISGSLAGSQMVWVPVTEDVLFVPPVVEGGK